jgi:cation diffusion facilitator family transporter
LLKTKNKIKGTEEGSLKIRLIAIGLSVLVGAFLMALKFLAYYLTGSSAILSDALESIINVVASAFALGSILFAARPPDASHPYGHGKIEYFSAGFEGALIILASLGILKTGVSQILKPRELIHLQDGLFILLGAGLANLMLGVLLVRTGKRTRSLVITADGKHVLTDVYTSAGVLIGLFLVRRTGWYWLDGAVACIVGLNIIVTGMRLVRQSFAGLMDASDVKLLEEISELINRHRKDRWIDIHQLRAWRSGADLHIDMHLTLPRDLTLKEAHAESKKLEKLINDHFGGNGSVLIHLDPCADPNCPACNRQPCRLRGESSKSRVPWNPEALIRQEKNGK